MITSITDYKDLIHSFVNKEINTIQFEEKYLKLFKYDDSLNEETYKILSPLFTAVEEFCPFPELREEGDVDEQQLFRQAVVTLEQLKQFDLAVVPARSMEDAQILIIEKVVERKLLEMLPHMIEGALLKRQLPAHLAK